MKQPHPYFVLWDREAVDREFPDHQSYTKSLGSDANNQMRTRLPAHISVAEPDI